MAPAPAALDEDEVLEEAIRRAGLDDFGDDDFREPLRVLLDSLDREAGLHAAGRAAQRERIVDSLTARLRTQDWCRRHPEILEEQVLDPIVIVGLARTGTTRLHRLLACDPAHLAPLWWECRHPAPHPDTRWDEPDPRIADAHAEVRAILETSPVLAAIHPWDAEGADEEILLLEHSFLSHVPESGADVPRYRSWLTDQDLTPAYRTLRRQLQFLQWQKRQRGLRGTRWVLKAPFHLGYLDVLFETFPGARVIQTHRDPLETIPSVASMYVALWELGADDVDPVRVGFQCRERFAWALRRSLATRDAEPPERFHDVDYAAALRDPIAEIRRIYAFLDARLSDTAETSMRSWLRDNAREKRPAHVYGPERFGFTEAGLRADFADYRARFIERDQG